MKRRFATLGIVLLAAAFACQETGAPDAADGPSLNETAAPTAEGQLMSMMDALNAALSSEGAEYRVAMAEYITHADEHEMGNTVIAKNVGNKQLSFDFVPGDGRRGWSRAGGTAITYAIDQTGDAAPVFGGLTGAQTTASIQAAMGTWDGVTCSVLGLTQAPDFGFDIGVVAFLNGLGGSPFIFADVQHAGWRDINFSGGILGATFTFGFVDGSGNFTDVDNNGKADAAFREIYYDPSFSWADDGTSNVDVETVALHEAGHGLSQAHFGTLFFDNNFNFQAAPRAVMNALYAGPLRALLGTDTGGHCSNWGQWPND